MKESSMFNEPLNSGVFDVLTPDNSILSVVLLIITLSVVSTVISYLGKNNRNDRYRYSSTRKRNKPNSDDY
jgi:hypothetical protein